MIVLKKLNDIEHEKELLVVKLSYLHILFFFFFKKKF
jgi:hypothetical protein